jgi:hypothetical protein
VLLYDSQKGRLQDHNWPLTRVELRGFEPLTPSMRTERSTRQSSCHTTFQHVRDVEPGMVTPPNRA